MSNTKHYNKREANPDLGNWGVKESAEKPSNNSVSRNLENF